MRPPRRRAAGISCTRGRGNRFGEVRGWKWGIPDLPKSGQARFTPAQAQVTVLIAAILEPLDRAEQKKGGAKMSLDCTVAPGWHLANSLIRART